MARKSEDTGYYNQNDHYNLTNTATRLKQLDLQENDFAKEKA